MTSTHIRLGDLQDKGICNGDSGGPSLHRFADGVTRVVGVHSYTEPGAGCLDGADVRVDRFGAFIKQYLTEKVGAACTEDGLCATSCPVGQQVCGDVCANTATDPTHCGDYATACDAGELCLSGVCATSCPTWSTW